MMVGKAGFCGALTDARGGWSRKINDSFAQACVKLISVIVFAFPRLCEERIEIVAK